jgi:hypothetical protein
MNEVPFGHGVLSQGEFVRSPEEDRLLAKKAWLYLWDHLNRHDEKLKARNLPVPWLLEDDVDIRDAFTKMWVLLRRFDGEETYLRYLAEQEQLHLDAYEHNLIERDNPRYKWIRERVVNDNPLTVLDVGAGWGFLACEIAKHNILVTSIAPVEAAVQKVKGMAQNEGLTLEWIHGRVFETIDFEDLKFDIVLCCEILEHVRDDLFFLQRCVDVAKRSVVVTVPYGSMGMGFDRDKYSFKTTEHVRAYSWPAFLKLLNSVQGVKPVCEDEVALVDAVINCMGDLAKCFCVKLIKEEVDGDTKVSDSGDAAVHDNAEPEAPLRRVEPEAVEG